MPTTENIFSASTLSLLNTRNGTYGSKIQNLVPTALKALALEYILSLAFCFMINLKQYTVL